MIHFSSVLYVKSTFEIIASDFLRLGSCLGQCPNRDFFQDQTSNYIHTSFLLLSTFLVVVGPCRLQLHGQYINESFVSPLSITRFILGFPPFTVLFISYSVVSSCPLSLIHPDICLLALFLYELSQSLCAREKQLTSMLQILGLFQQINGASTS